MSVTVEQYEANQHHNQLNSWLHGFRYRALMRSAAALARPGERLRVLEIGCAYGKAFGLLDRTFAVDYAGVDAHPGFVTEARRRFGSRPNFQIHEGDALGFLRAEGAALGPVDLVFALETFEHLRAEEAPALLGEIAALKPRLFAASVPVEIGPAVAFKNVGSALTGYSRHHEYSWRDTFWASLYRLDKVAPHAQGHKGFDWRNLKREIGSAMRIERVERFPVRWLPSALAASVYITATPRAG